MGVIIRLWKRNTQDSSGDCSDMTCGIFVVWSQNKWRNCKI